MPLTPKSLNIASLNVNSIRARLENVLNWLLQAKNLGKPIDILMLQEIKCTAEQFPTSVFEELGYNLAINGEKSYNGVAILSKFPFNEVIRNLPTAENSQEPCQARYIEVTININNQLLRLSSVYVPNGGINSNIGGEVHQQGDKNWQESTKFQYKLAFLNNLQQHLGNNLNYANELQIIGGDFNVACSNIDVYNPHLLQETLCCSKLERQYFRQVINLGFFDSYRLINQQQQEFSWWDYRKQAFAKNHGLRLDYLLLNAKASNYLVDAKLISSLRNQQNPSDHCPCLINLEFNLT